MSRCVSAGCRWLIASGVALCLVQTTSAADHKGEALPEGWEMRTFRLPAGFWWWHAPPAVEPPAVDTFGPDENTHSPLDAVPPPLPPPDAPDQDWAEHIRKSSILIGRLIRDLGIASPEGSLFLHDVDSGTLVVRSTQGVMDQLTSIAEDIMGKSAQTVGFTLDVVQAESAIIQQAVSDTTATSDHTAVWRRLQKLTGEKVTHVRHLQVETKSGFRVSVRDGADTLYSTGLKLDASGRAELSRENRCAGTLLELDPAISSDGFTVDVELTMEHHFGPPVQRHEIVGHAGALGKLEIPVTDFRCARIKSAITMHSGATQLLGVWFPESLPDAARGRTMQAAFFGVNVIPLLKEENKSLGGRLERYIAKSATQAESKPGSAKDQAQSGQSISAKMELRTYKVPRGFVDDFYALAKSKDASTSPIPVRDGGPTPESVLRDNGITSPPGSDFRLEPSNCTLVAVNTRENLDLIGLLVKSTWTHQILTLTLTLQIVEGDGAFIRRIAAESRGVAAHDSLWREAEKLLREGRLSLRSTARVSGRSGAKMSFEAGTLHTTTHGLEFVNTSQKPSDASKKADAPAAKPLESGYMTAKYDTRMAGMRIEADPVIAPDGVTVDVDLSLEHHYAPPSIRAIAASPGSGALNTDISATDYHYGHVATALTLSSGMTKLVGTWTAEGKPEYEGKDVMQAAFLRVDVVTLGKE